MARGGSTHSAHIFAPVRCMLLCAQATLSRPSLFVLRRSSSAPHACSWTGSSAFPLPLTMRCGRPTAVAAGATDAACTSDATPGEEVAPAVEQTGGTVFAGA